MPLLSFDWNEMLKAGWNTKDFIAPSSMKFNKANFEIGASFGAINGMNILAGELPDTILSDFLELQHLFCVNLHVTPLDQITALKFVKTKLTAVESMKIDEQKKSFQSRLRSGYSSSGNQNVHYGSGKAAG